MALVQVIVAMAMILLCGVAGVRALVEMNRKAAAMRTLNNARAVVQRNIDTALGVPFSRTAAPAVLAITPAAGVIYDEDGNGDGLVDVVTPRSGVGAVVQGTLLRTVLAEPGSEGADVRRVSFQLTYTYRAKPYTYQMSTLRAQD
ncbi:MAG: hypothetical protein JWQ44_1814 [Chthoniobacter sp.]|jgi:hypothetical protein|nr:hypothetical protein [Chthoniobacter sp.]